MNQKINRWDLIVLIVIGLALIYSVSPLFYQFVKSRAEIAFATLGVTALGYYLFS